MPALEPRLGVVVERGDLLHRGTDPRPLLQDGRPEVAVIDDLVLVLVVRVVGQLVLQGKLRLTWHYAQLGPGDQLAHLEGALVHPAPHVDGVGRLLVHCHADHGRRYVLHPAVQALEAAVVIHPGVAGPLIAATYQHLVEAIEPAETGAALQIDEGRVDHLLDRGIPTEAHIGPLDLLDPHATGRHQGDLHHPVVDDEQIHPLLAPAVQAPLLDGEGYRALDPQLVAGDLPVPHIQPLLGVGQQELGGLARTRAQGEQHGNGEFLQHGFILVSLVFGDS
ncbi:hypothetical protein D3C75_749560 [compost metagenome]